GERSWRSFARPVARRADGPTATSAPVPAGTPPGGGFSQGLASFSLVFGRMSVRQRFLWGQQPVSARLSPHPPPALRLQGEPPDGLQHRWSRGCGAEFAAIVPLGSVLARHPVRTDRNFHSGVVHR